MTVYGWTRGDYLVPYYSGVVVGAYATSNGKFGEDAFETYISKWRYVGLGQVKHLPPDQVPVYWDTGNASTVTNLEYRDLE